MQNARFFEAVEALSSAGFAWAEIKELLVQVPVSSRTGPTTVYDRDGDKWERDPVTGLWALEYTVRALDGYSPNWAWEDLLNDEFSPLYYDAECTEEVPKDAWPL